MIRNFWFQIHWFIGITAGIVIAIVGFTGGLLSLEGDILKAINPGILTVVPEGGQLKPQALVESIREQLPDARIAALTLSGDPADSAKVQLEPPPGERRGPQLYIDPYSGKLLGEPRGKAFFGKVMELHRWLLAGDLGKQIVGFCTLALIFLASSGLYLRWPKRWNSLRTWLTFNPRKRGRSFLWDLHTVIGTWVLPFYLLASLTGLYWSYEWYRNGLYTLSGVEQPARRGPPNASNAGQAVKAGAGGTLGARDQQHPEATTEHRDFSAQAVSIDLNALWAAFETAVPTYGSATLRFPREAGQKAELGYQDKDPPHSRANNQIEIDQLTGNISVHRRYADKPLKEKLLGSMLPLHSGEYFGRGGLLLMMIASLLMPLFAITGWMLYLDRRGKKRDKRAIMRSVVSSEGRYRSDVY